jgi:hypothetical protein
VTVPDAIALPTAAVPEIPKEPLLVTPEPLLVTPEPPPQAVKEANNPIMINFLTRFIFIIIKKSPFLSEKF